MSENKDLTKILYIFSIEKLIFRFLAENFHQNKSFDNEDEACKYDSDFQPVRF